MPAHLSPISPLYVSYSCRLHVEDMVIEYAGEMVRPSVADRREAASYNQLVGAGTYVFTLDDDYMVDATKAGNMAHLLNHSCNPNCYSKHVHVWNEERQSKEPHVVICARQSIGVHEELTYDYRCGLELDRHGC